MHDDGVFGEEVAAHYDELHAGQFDPVVVDPMADFLAELVGDGRALELAIGTGRIGLPLAQRGVQVHGIEQSQAMVTRLRAKPGSEAVAISIGDMATTRVPGSFSLAYLVANTIGNLTTQEAQVACFRNAAAHLEPGGCFVVELIVPDLQWLPPGERTRTFHFSDHHVGIDEYDVANQRLTSHHWTLNGERWARFSVPFRYAWPAELDLMAQLAGMRLRERWGGWKREPFTSDSRKHVSVWEKALYGGNGGAMERSAARAVADLEEGLVLATVEVEAPPERAFRALASNEVVDWWVRPGVFDTREWKGDLRVGGRWETSGVGKGGPYGLEGEFLGVDPPRKLVHTWHLVGAPGAPTTVSYLLDHLDGGTRITLRHSGFTSPEPCTATCVGWETSFERLAEYLAARRSPSPG